MVNLFKLFAYITLSILLTSCSFNNTGGFFDNRYYDLEQEVLKKNSKLVFAETKKFNEEILGNISAQISEPIINKNWTQKNLTSGNYIPHLKYENKKQLIHKSKKIGKNKFKIPYLNSEPLLINDNILFSDLSGNIYVYSIDQKEIKWKFNFYKKRFKNLPIIIQLKIFNDNLIASDNLGYLYSLKINTGKLNWAKNYGIPFSSNIKIDNENIFILNQDNKYYSIKVKDGVQNLSLETFPNFLSSKQETNISLDDLNKNLYFITSTGELYSVNYRINNLNWLFTLFSGTKSRGDDLFFSSPIVYKNDKIFFSTSLSTYSINSRNGKINWEIPFSTYIRPIVTDDFIFFASKDGFLINLNINNGQVNWSKYIYKSSKKLKKEKIGDIVSLSLVSNQVLATTSNGYLLFINFSNGDILNYTRASKGGFYSNPIIANGKIYILDRKMRLLIYN